MVVQVQVVVQVVYLMPEAQGAKLLANDIARQTRVQHELPAAQAASTERNLSISIDSKTRLPKRDHEQHQDPQKETGEGWP